MSKINPEMNSHAQGKRHIKCIIKTLPSNRSTPCLAKFASIIISGFMVADEKEAFS